MNSPELIYLKKCNLGKKYDLCISLEVAEHIEEDRADLFIDNLCDASDVILFSAALPKQGGVDTLTSKK